MSKAEASGGCDLEPLQKALLSLIMTQSTIKTISSVRQNLKDDEEGKSFDSLSSASSRRKRLKPYHWSQTEWLT